MAVIKCKMCGGDIKISQDKTMGTCEYCDSVMTLPKINDEQRASAFNRGNYFRRIGEFDKAVSVYEQIVQEDNTDAEAYWCCVLSRFGIEYVEDPVTHEWIPTCHRASYDSVLEDIDYLAAVECADSVAREHYQNEAAKIAEVQKNILLVSQKEEPFDVFICYKESDENNNRTIDSTLAQDVFYQLTDKGYRVFFARITLEDKVGREYEPYIFSALQSAKIMVTIGTKSEYYNATWVKNEWSRFLALMKKDTNKLLLPCYKDMNPYDMPEQLSRLQSYDMGKIGFVQDLIRGIEKIIPQKTEEKVDTQVVREVVNSGNSGNLQSLLKRGKMALEDGDWDNAFDFYEDCLNIDPECGEAYYGKFLARLENVSLENYERQVLHMTLNGKTNERMACLEDEEFMRKMEREYAGRGHRLTVEELKKKVYFDLTYTSSLVFRQNQLQTLKCNISNIRKNNEFVRCLQYSSDEFRSMVDSTFERMQNVMSERILEEEEKDNQISENIRKEYEEFKKEVYEKIKKDDKEYQHNEYERGSKMIDEVDILIQQAKTLNNINLQASMSEKYSEASSIFGELAEANYKDSKQKTLKYRTAAVEAEAKAEALTKRNKRIIKLIKKLVVFAIGFVIGRVLLNITIPRIENVIEYWTVPADQSIGFFKTIGYTLVTLFWIIVSVVYAGILLIAVRVAGEDKVDTISSDNDYKQERL